MNKNIRIAKELVKIAKSLVALDGQDGLPIIQKDYQETRDQMIHIFEQDRLDEAERQGKKYILHHKEQGLWRIQSCKDFSVLQGEHVKKGSFGGLIKSEKNLSHEGNCWIFEGVKVFGNAKVYGNAQVYGEVWISNEAQVYEKALVCSYDEKALVSGKAKVYGNALVSGNVKIYGDAQVYGNAQIYENAKIFGNAKVYGNAIVDYDVKDEEVTE